MDNNYSINIRSIDCCYPNNIELFVKDVFVEIYKFGSFPNISDENENLKSLIDILSNYKPVKLNIIENVSIENERFEYLENYFRWFIETIIENQDFVENEKITLKDIKNKLGSYSRVTKKIDLNCSICQNGFKLNEGLRKLGCSHMFHKKCVDKWFIKSRKWNCPLCRCDSTLKSTQ